MDEQLRELHLLGATGTVRTVTHNGRNHYVVPVIALMEGVIHAVNAADPEFVPSARLAQAAHTWNGRPLVIGHPTKDGKQISANSVTVLERQGFGTIFESQYANKKLGMMAYVDPERLETLGQTSLLERIKKGDPIEVSVGAYVKTLAKVGTYGNKAYKYEWQEIQGDHLAFLPNGRGACSLDMGCGAHRSASAYLVTAEGFVSMDESNQATVDAAITALGGPGSGNFGHGGRPGEVGGSEGGGGGYQLHDTVSHMGMKYTVSGISGGTGMLALSPLDQHGKIDHSKKMISVHPDRVTGSDKSTEDALAELKKQTETAETIREHTSRGGTFERDATDPKITRRVPAPAASSALKRAIDKARVKGVDDHLKKFPEGQSDEATAHYNKIRGYLSEQGYTPTSVRKGSGADYTTFSHPEHGTVSVDKVYLGVIPGDRAKGYRGTTKVRVRWESPTLKGAGMNRGLLGRPKGAVTEAVFVGLDDQSLDDRISAVNAAVSAEYAKVGAAATPGSYAYARYVYEDYTIISKDGKLYRCDYEVGDDGKVMLDGDMVEVRQLPPKFVPLNDEYDDVTALEEFMALAGARHSASDKTMIQTVHNHSVDLGAECSAMKGAAAYEDCTACEGSGSKDGNPCEACDGNGRVKKIKAAAATCGCGGQRAAEGENMERKDRITALMANEHNPIKSQKTLDALPEDELTALETACKSAADLKAASATLTTENTTLKAAAAQPTQPKVLTEDEYLAQAPESIRTLVSEKKATDAARKTELIASLKAAQSVYDETKLTAMSVAELENVASLVSIAKPDYSAARVIPRAAGANDVYANPPNPYGDEALKAHREKYVTQ